MKDSEIYATHQPCFRCADQMVQVGIKKVYFVFTYQDQRGLKVLNDANIPYQQLTMPSLKITLLK